MKQNEQKKVLDFIMKLGDHDSDLSWSVLALIVAANALRLKRIQTPEYLESRNALLSEFLSDNKQVATAFTDQPASITFKLSPTQYPIFILELVEESDTGAILRFSLKTYMQRKHTQTICMKI
ncbi:MAG: hypothetical protein WCJ81_06900 [bacterium]